VSPDPSRLVVVAQLALLAEKLSGLDTASGVILIQLVPTSIYEFKAESIRDIPSTCSTTDFQYQSINQHQRVMCYLRSSNVLDGATLNKVEPRKQIGRRSWQILANSNVHWKVCAAIIKIEYNPKG
jgi:hypothetical protein